MTKRPLNPRQKQFVKEYLADFNAKAAAIRAGYSAANANKHGSRLIHYPQVAKEIDRAMKRRAKKLGLDKDKVLKELARLAFFDPRKLYHEDGTPKAVHELDDDTAAAVMSLDIREEYSGRGKDRVKVGEIKRWRLANKLDALGQVAKHLGIAPEQQPTPADDGQVVVYLPDNGR